MNKARRYLIWGWVAASAAIAGSAHALSLGKLRGAALLGQPLELSLAMQLASDEDASGVCVAAEVVYGDVLVEPSAVSARVVQGSGSGVNVEVLVRRPVDEPVVTVYLRTGCRTAVSRKYVLLAELVSESLPLLKPTEPGRVTAPPRAAASEERTSAAIAPARAPEGLTSAARPASIVKTPRIAPTEAEAPAKAARLEKPKPMAAEVLVPEARKVPQRPGAVGSGARLKLTPLDLSKDWDPSLRFATQLSEVNPNMDAAQRAQAQAMWRALQATPEELLLEQQQRAGLEKELAALTQQSRANQQAIAEMTMALNKAQESRLSNPAMWVLLVLLLVSGALLAWRTRQLRGAGPATPWWAGEGQSGGVPDSDGPMQADERQGMARSESRPMATVAREEEVQPPAMQPPGSSAPTELPSDFSRTPARHSRPLDPALTHSDFANSVTGALRSINTQELLDVRQQADFFLALGQHDEAAQLLQSALGQQRESNPHIYMDLLELLHRLGRKDEFERTRAAFMARYTGLVPPFGDFAKTGKGLLEYADVTDALVACWPSRYALEYLEQCLVRESADAPDCGFELEAFKELLLLHAMLARFETLPEPTGGKRPAYRILPAGDMLVARAASKASWGSSVPLDLDLS